MNEVWSYLSHDPLLWLTMTILAYMVGLYVHISVGRSALANPSLLAMIPLALGLHISGTSFATYFEGAQFVHFLLGPATVCLALPLFDNIQKVRRAALPLVVSLVVGSSVGIVTALSIAWAFGSSLEVLASVAPKSATAAVAIGIAEQNGGSATLATLMVVMTGLTGAALATPLLNLLRIHNWSARGFATGVAAHGFGTARAMQVHPTAGAFAGLGMGLNALLTAILAPIVLAWFN